MSCSQLLSKAFAILDAENRLAGFREMHDPEWSKSEVPEFCGRETRVETFLAVEAVKW